MSIPIETFFLDPDAEGTLQGRIQQIIAKGILSGRFRKNEKLPSTRRLATHLGISRITVTLAYTELLANDYLTSKGRSGYYVSPEAPEPTQFKPLPKSEEKVDWTRAIAKHYSETSTFEKPEDWARYRFPFIYGQTDPSLFDHANWRACAMKALGAKDFSSLTADYFDRDDPELIEFIARQTLPRRGIIAAPNEILVTLGAQNALWLSTQVLLNQRRKAVIENPCYPALRNILYQSRCHIAAVDVDDYGIPPQHIPNDSSVIFTTPSHQCPTTATMPLQRRKALLAKAQALDALIIEDDYEFEMSFLRSPSPALKSLDEDGRVIYVGSFSKSLFPGLRLGYLVGSAAFIHEARALRASVLRHPPGHIQRTAAYFLRFGYYDALIKRMGKKYLERSKVMEQAIANHGLEIAGKGMHGGSSFWMRAPIGCDTTELAIKLRTQSVLIEPGQAFFNDSTPPKNYFRLAFSSIPAGKISSGIAGIAAILS